MAMGSLLLALIAGSWLGVVMGAHLNLSSWVFDLLLVICLLAGVLGVTAWMTGLITMASRSEWGWLVATILLGVFGALAYGLAALVPVRPQGREPVEVAPTA